MGRCRRVMRRSLRRGLGEYRDMKWCSRWFMTVCFFVHGNDLGGFWMHRTHMGLGLISYRKASS